MNKGIMNKARDSQRGKMDFLWAFEFKIQIQTK